MKKFIIAGAAISSIIGSAFAQSSITIYGIADAGIVHERGGVAGPITKLSSGIGSTSRLGFRGLEDLGGGLSAIFTLETGVKIDTGEVDTAGTIFNRQAFVGLRSAYGTLTLGRQYTPYYNTVSVVADPFGAGYAGSIKNLFPTAGNNTRTSNTLLYVSPKKSGIWGELAYSLGEQPESSIAGRQIGVAFAYANGPLNARLGYSNRNNDITAAAAPQVPVLARDTGRNLILAANYNFGVLKGFVAIDLAKGFNSAVLSNSSNPFGGSRPTASLDSRNFLLGMSMPVRAATLLASYIRKDDRTGFNQDADQWAVGCTYAMSTRTSLYSTAARIKNRRGAGYTVGNNSEVGTGNRAINAGVRHSF